MNNIVSKILKTTQKLWFGEQTDIKPAVNRRQFLRHGRGLSLILPVALSPLALRAPTAQAQTPSNRTATQRPLTVVQIVDMSVAQQDVSKDFLIGSRAAWQDINARGGVRGRAVTHWVLETDGSAQSLRAAWAQVRNNPDCVVMSGSAADPLAGQVNALLTTDKLGIAHVAPWLQNSSVELDPHTFTVFASRDEQIAHALKSLSTMGLRSLSVVFASDIERQQNIADLQRITNTLQLTLQEQALTNNLRDAGQRLGSTAAAVILFVGGTPELAQFTQGLEKQARQRYVVALADVNLQTLQQMTGTKTTPIIVTQAVPMVNSALPIVRDYRQTLARLYDEPPTPLSLAGFIAARYTFEVMQGIPGNVNRPTVLEAFSRRQAVDLGGFRVAFDAQKRTSVYVTQSMLGADGRIIG
jgi:ABC-type branched-subunit amino acid transport system substrate-binding protein